jgi:hypothetical protein
VAWFYNWGSETSVKSETAQFIPMIFSLKKIDANVTSSIILGFNEPDHSKQSNISVEEALENWPKVVSKSAIVGAPAMAGNSVTGEWLPKFMES